MKVFKDNLFAIILIALVSIMWSLPIDINAAGAGGEALPETASDKAKPEAPGGEHSMAGIIGKRGVNINEKNRRIRAYLTGKYKARRASAKGRSYGYGSIIENIYLSGDFTPPGYVKRADVDEDIRARSRAFLEEEKEQLVLNDLENELGGGVEERGSGSSAHKAIIYYIEVEGLPVSGSTFSFVFTEDGEPISMNGNPRLVTPEMRAAAKRFRAEGTTAADIKEAVRADLVKRGVPQANIDGMKLEFSSHPGTLLVEKEPYVIWDLVVTYPRYKEDWGYWGYEFNAITGEVISRESWVSY